VSAGRDVLERMAARVRIASEKEEIGMTFKKEIELVGKSTGCGSIRARFDEVAQCLVCAQGVD
jgi:hypothetical protein